MAYDPRLPFMFQYQPSQRDPRTLAQVQAGALANQAAEQNIGIDREQQNNANATESRTATSFGQLNPIQALIAQQVQQELQKPQQVPAPVQQALGAGDRYSPIEQGINRDAQLVQQRQGNLASASFNPNNPLSFLANRDQNQQAISDDMGKLDARRSELGQSREWEAIVPQLEAITVPAVQFMRGQNRDQSIDTWNSMLAGIQGAVAKANPALLQNKGFKEYMSNLEKLKPAPQEPNPYRQDMANFNREKFENEKAQKLLDRVAKYRNETEKDRDSGAQIKEVDSVLSKMGVKGGIFGNSNEVDIPGFGVGEKAFRKFAQSKDAVNLRATVSALMNAYRNGIFGASLTEGEQKAFEEFSGTGIMANQEALFSGLRNINRAVDQRLRPESDEVSKALKDRGILTHEDLPRPKPKASGFSPDKAARLRELRAKKAAGTLK